MDTAPPCMTSLTEIKEKYVKSLRKYIKYNIMQHIIQKEEANQMEYQNLKLAEFQKKIKGKKVAIIGLGVSNIPLIEYLKEIEAEITVFDKREYEKLDMIAKEKIEKYQIRTILGPDNLKELKGFDYIFRSPSCRPDFPEIQEEVKRGAILTSEIEQVMELSPSTIIGITGSDGKTTTTSLIYEILKQKGFNTYLGGNIGIPLFTRIKDMKPEDVVVLELSSFQLMNMKVSPHIAVITNITPNHLDIHKSYQEYIDAKKRIFSFQNAKDILVLNYDNDNTRKMKEEAKSRVIFFSGKEKLEDGYIVDNDTIKYCNQGLRRHLLKTKDIYIRGKHNYENIAAAIAATSSLVDFDTQIKAISKFKGVEHRLEFVREIGEVKWYNDSIGTSPTRTIAGLYAFDENIVLIAGGYDKNLDYEPLAKPIIEKVSDLILVGATSEKIQNAVKRELKNQENEIDIYRCKTLEEAVRTAREIAKPKDIVLFSPASASFDMFKNFEERGKKYKEIVNQLV